MYVALWRLKIELIQKERFSAQYQEAWAASFPSDLWPAEEVDNNGFHFRLKDGTLLPAFGRLQGGKLILAKEPSEQSGLTETAEATGLNGSAPGLQGTL